MKIISFVSSRVLYSLLIGLALPVLGQGLGEEGVRYIAEVQYFTPENGLAHRLVKDVLQDSKGFIWMGTRRGLSRFDGHEWRTFSKEKNGLANNNISQIEEDDEGWLWLITTSNDAISHISFIHSLTLETTTFEARFGASLPFQIENIRSVQSDEKRNIYISQHNELLTFQKGEWSSQVIKGAGDFILKEKTASGDWVIQIIQNKKIQLARLDRNGQLRSLKVLNEKEIINHFTDQQGNFWLIDGGKIYRLPNRQDRFEQFDISQQLSIPYNKHQSDFTFNLFHQSKDGKDFFWYKNREQFFIYNADNRIIYDFKKEYPEIIDNYIQSIYFDQQRNIWVSTDFGIYKIQLIPTRFQNYLTLPLGTYNTSLAKSIRGIHLNGQKLWVNTVFYNDYIVDLATKTAQEVPKTLNIYGKRRIFRPILHLKDNEYMVFDEELVRYKDYQPVENYIWKTGKAVNFAWSLHQDAQKNIWIGTHEKGLAILDNDSIAYYDRYDDFKKLSKSSVYHFLQWDTENIFIASTSGIYILNKDKGIVQCFSSASPDAQKIPFDIIHHLHRDAENENVLWVATGGGGILKLTLDSEDWSIQTQQQITIFDGLSNNVIYAIYEDAYQNLWMSSDLGINRYHKQSGQTKVYTTQDGLPFNEFNRTSHHQAADGRLFFGSMNGVASFYPNQLLNIKDSTSASLRLTQTQQFIGKTNQIEDRTADFFNQKKIVLQPNDKFLNLKFALLEYQEASQIQYSYQLLGQGDEWIYLNDNQLRLSGLPYGNHVLNIRAEGVLNQNEAAILAIPIQVIRPLYLRWWFMLFVLMAVVAAIIYFFRRRTQAFKQRQKELETLVAQRTQKIQKAKATIEAQAEKLRELDKVKSRFFANVSHELRTPLTLMLAPIENTLKENQLTNRAYTNLLLAQKNGQRLHRMVNEILDLTKLEAGRLQVHQQKTVLYTFLKNITASFESVANQSEVDFIFKYQEDKYLQLLLDQRKVEIILLNLLSNAFKFTPKQGRVQLSVTNEGEFINFTVSDTGRGIHPEDLPNIFNRFYQSKKKDAAKGGTGIGLALSREFATLLGGTITVESQLNEGATFTVRLPKQELISQVNETDAILIQNEALHTDNQLEIYPQTTPIPVSSTSAATILLVEDNHDLRFFIKSILSTEYNVITAENGKVGLEKLSIVHCQLLISDIMMPIMDGYEFVEKVKSDERFNHIPIIVLTARAALEDKMKALRIGVDDYLNKPFVEEELFVRIENLLRNAKNRQTVIEEAIVEKEATPVPKTKQTTPSTITPEMQTWLAEVEALLLEKIETNDYTIDQLARDMAISKRQLSRRIKEIVGVTPNQYLKTIRYTKARELLENKTYTSVKAVAYAVGFKDVRYFSSQFRKRFGENPSEYL